MGGGSGMQLKCIGLHTGLLITNPEMVKQLNQTSVAVLKIGIGTGKSLEWEWPCLSAPGIENEH